MVEGKGFVTSTLRLSAYLAVIPRRQTAVECPPQPFRVPIRPHFWCTDAAAAGSADLEMSLEPPERLRSQLAVEILGQLLDGRLISRGRGSD